MQLVGGFQIRMDNVCRYADRPIAFLARYVMVRPVAHGVIIAAVLAAGGCSVGAQYGIKGLVGGPAGGLSGGGAAARSWLGFLLLPARLAPATRRWRPP